MIGLHDILIPTQWVKSTDIVTTNSVRCQGEEYWDLVNKLEQAWTGVAESDRALISDHVPQHHRGPIIMVCPL